MAASVYQGVKWCIAAKLVCVAFIQNTVIMIIVQSFFQIGFYFSPIIHNWFARIQLPYLLFCWICWMLKSVLLINMSVSYSTLQTRKGSILEESGGVLSISIYSLCLTKSFYWAGCTYLGTDQLHQVAQIEIEERWCKGLAHSRTLTDSKNSRQAKMDRVEVEKGRGLWIYEARNKVQ